MRASAHPILALGAINVGIMLYAFSIDHSYVAAIFAVLLPFAFLVGLAQTLRTHIARSTRGSYRPSERPFAYWFHVAFLAVGYLFVSAAPILARYFLPSAQP